MSLFGRNGLRPLWLAWIILPFLGLSPSYGQLDLSRAAGQLFIFGLPWVDKSDGTLSISSISHFKSLNAGSFILFRRDVRSSAQIRLLTDQLQRIAIEGGQAPALVAVDQEGGLVTRIPFDPPLPSAFTVGRLGSSDLAYSLGLETANFLRQLGINGNLAPVLDLGSESGTFIGTRAYSSNEMVVAELGTAFAKGLSEGNVLPVAKHFPGIGPVANDPHLTLVRRSTPATELLSRDLIPFRKFASLQPSGLMISHLIYPALDPTGLPGTFSQSIQKKYAREIVGYSGLLFTDDLLMFKYKRMSDFKRDVQRAFVAGSDLIMVSWSLDRQKAAVEAILEGVQKGLFSPQEVISRAQRVLAVRQKIGRPEFSAPINNDRIRLHLSERYLNSINELSASLFREQAKGILSSNELLAVINPPRELAKELKNLPPKRRPLVLKEISSCPKKYRCAVFSKTKKERAALISLLSKGQRAAFFSRTFLVDFVDDTKIKLPIKVVHVPVRSPSWPKHLLDSISGISAKNGLDISARD